MTSRDAIFADLYRRYRGPVSAYCRRRTTADKAEDAVADVFLIAWRRIEDVPEGERALPWLYGVAYKVLGRQWRGQSRQRRLGEKLANLGVAPDDEPDEVVVRRQEAVQMERALAKLNPTDREILMLAAWEELPLAQISEVLGIGTGAVSQRFYQAKKNLTLQFNRLGSGRSRIPVARRGGKP